MKIQGKPRNGSEMHTPFDPPLAVFREHAPDRSQSLLNCNKAFTELEIIHFEDFDPEEADRQLGFQD